MTTCLLSGPQQSDKRQFVPTWAEQFGKDKEGLYYPSFSLLTHSIFLSDKPRLESPHSVPKKGYSLFQTFPNFIP